MQKLADDSTLLQKSLTSDGKYLGGLTCHHLPPNPLPRSWDRASGVKHRVQKKGVLYLLWEAHVRDELRGEVRLSRNPHRGKTYQFLNEEAGANYKNAEVLISSVQLRVRGAGGAERDRSGCGQRRLSALAERRDGIVRKEWSSVRRIPVIDFSFGSPPTESRKRGCANLASLNKLADCRLSISGVVMNSS